MTKHPILIGYYTMVRKELIRILRIWSQTLLPPIVTTTLYFIVFGSAITTLPAMAINGLKFRAVSEYSRLPR